MIYNNIITICSFAINILGFPFGGTHSRTEKQTTTPNMNGESVWCISSFRKFLKKIKKLQPNNFGVFFFMRVCVRESKNLAELLFFVYV